MARRVVLGELTPEMFERPQIKGGLKGVKDELDRSVSDWQDFLAKEREWQKEKRKSVTRALSLLSQLICAELGGN